jgi:transcriptional regulator with XRE-family HTH domain
MKRTAHRAATQEAEPVRILGRGLRAQRGVRLTMRALREGAGRTQVDVAQAAQIDQSDISRLENKREFDDCQVSTLRRYVDAIGGRLEIVAAFGDKKIVLVGVEDRAAPLSLERKHARKAIRKSKT